MSRRLSVVVEYGSVNFTGSAIVRNGEDAVSVRIEDHDAEPDMIAWVNDSTEEIEELIGDAAVATFKARQAETMSEHADFDDEEGYRDDPFGAMDDLWG